MVKKTSAEQGSRLLIDPDPFLIAATTAEQGRSYPYMTFEKNRIRIMLKIMEPDPQPVYQHSRTRKGLTARKLNIFLKHN